MFRVDDPRSEPRALHEFKQNKMAEDAESDIAIRFVDENDYREISACIELIVQQETLNTLNILSGSFMIYSLKFEDSNFWFDIYSVFYYSTKITLGVLLALLYKRPVSIDRRNFSFY